MSYWNWIKRCLNANHLSSPDKFIYHLSNTGSTKWYNTSLGKEKKIKKGRRKRRTHTNTHTPIHTKNDAMHRVGEWQFFLELLLLLFGCVFRLCVVVVIVIVYLFLYFSHFFFVLRANTSSYASVLLISTSYRKPTYLHKVYMELFIFHSI